MVLEAWSPQRTALTSLANVWLAEGATAVTISINGIPVVALSADGRHPHAANGQGARRRAHLAAPIEWEGGQAGEIRIMAEASDGSPARGAFTEAAEARVAAEAQLVGLLLEAEADLASVTDELIQTQDQLLAVYDLGQLARRPMGLSERLFALAEAACRLLNVDGTAVVLASDARRPHAAQYPPGAQDEAWLVALLCCLPADPFQPSPDGPSSENEPSAAVLWQGRDAVQHPSAAGPPADGCWLPDSIESLLMVPIGPTAAAGGPVQGAFVFWSEQPERFASPDAKLALAIAEHAGVQIENALLQRDRIAQARLETEMQLARQVQTNLLPKALPRLPGLDLYACMRPASHVGGDFFDFVVDASPGALSAGGSPVPTGITFLVSDVSGKGMSAALVMTMTRTILRSVVGQAKARGADALPQAALMRAGSLLTLVNDELFQDLTDLSMFATVFVGQYQSLGRCLTYANAGHSPVIYMPAGARPQLLEADFPPIGVMPALDKAWPLVGGERTLALGPGDLLVAASDGFNETRNTADEMFGLERLLRCVEEGAHLSAEALGQALVAAVEAFRDGEIQEDDQTLVIAKGTLM